MDVIEILLMIPPMLLALFGNIISYDIKQILKNEGHKVSFFFGHFSDILKFIELIQNTEEGGKKLKYKRKLRTLIVVLVSFIISATVLFTYLISMDKNMPMLINEVECQEFKEYKRDSWKGIVIDKYINEPSDSTKTIVLEHKGVQQKLFGFIFYNNYDLYEKIEIGDSLIKENNEDFSILKKQGSEIRYYPNVSCKGYLAPLKNYNQLIDKLDSMPFLN